MGNPRSTAEVLDGVDTLTEALGATREAVRRKRSRIGAYFPHKWVARELVREALELANLEGGYAEVRGLAEVEPHRRDDAVFTHERRRAAEAVVRSGDREEERARQLGAGQALQWAIQDWTNVEL